MYTKNIAVATKDAKGRLVVGERYRVLDIFEMVGDVFYTVQLETGGPVVIVLSSNFETAK